MMVMMMEWLEIVFCWGE